MYPIMLMRKPYIPMISAGRVFVYGYSPGKQCRKPFFLYAIRTFLIGLSDP